MNLIIKITALSLIISLFNACTSKNTLHGEFNNDHKKFIEKNYKKTTTKNYLKDSIKEIEDKNEYINLDNTKRLSSILENLGDIDGKSYMLSSDSEDIFLRATTNSHKLKIDNFEKINQYLKDSSNYLIYVKSNRFIKNRIKIVSVKNKDNIEQNLKDIPFSLDSKAAVSEILEQVRDISGFNVIAKNIPIIKDDTVEGTANGKLFAENTMDTLFENTYISFGGNNIMELLNYISTSFNIYVDVDYENKTIVFEKQKPKSFNIILNNINYTGSLDVEKSISNDVGEGDSGKKTIKTKIKLEIMDSLEQSLNTILRSSGIQGNVIAFNKTIGSIFVIADKKTMKEIATQINNFNDVFKKQIDFKLEIFEFAVTKEFNAGVSLGGTINTSNLTGNFLTSTVSNSIFNIETKSDTSGIKGVNLNNKTIRLIKQTRHGYILKNSIPYSIDVTNSKSYVKTVNTETTVSNGVSTTETTPETSEINEGTVLSVLAKVNGNQVEFNLQPKIVRINGIETATFDGNSISLPDLSVNTFSSNVILKNGEKKIIGYLTTYEDTNNYNGIVPIENFILGGARSKSYFRKETVFVISATIRE